MNLLFAKKLELFRCYKNIYGHMLIPEKFKIPHDSKWPQYGHGFNLGIAAGYLAKRMRSKNFRGSQEAKSLLQLGFIESNFKYRSWIVLKGIETYKAIYGTVKIPSAFTVPADERWLKPLWGSNLGSSAYKLMIGITHQRLKKYIDDIENGKPIPEYTHPDFAKIPEGLPLNIDEFIDLLAIYKSLYGNTLVPRTFHIPPTDPWPKQFHHLHLGRWNIKLKKDWEDLPEHYSKRLSELGYVDNVQEYKSEIALEVCKTFYNIYGHLNIPYCYKVPKDDERWPSHLVGIDVCYTVYTIRSGSFPSIHEEIRKMDPTIFEAKHNVKEFDVILEGLKAFIKIHGHSYVNMAFTIPENSTIYPSSTWNMNLGYITHNIRCKGAYDEYKEQLLAIGFDYRSYHDFFTDCIIKSYHIYQKIHSGRKYNNNNNAAAVDMNNVSTNDKDKSSPYYVKFSYTIDEDDERYPLMCRGMKLGRVIHRIRIFDTYREYAEKFYKAGLLKSLPPPSDDDEDSEDDTEEDDGSDEDDENKVVDKDKSNDSNNNTKSNNRKIRRSKSASRNIDNVKITSSNSDNNGNNDS